MWIILIYKTTTNINTNRLPPPSFYSYPYGRWVITVQNFSVCVCVCVCSTRERWKNGDGSFALYLLLFLCVRCVCYLLSTPALVTILYWCSYTIQRRKKETSSHELVFEFYFEIFLFTYFWLSFSFCWSHDDLFKYLLQNTHKKKGKERKELKYSMIMGDPSFFPHDRLNRFSPCYFLSSSNVFN